MLVYCTIVRIWHFYYCTTTLLLNSLIHYLLLLNTELRFSRFFMTNCRMYEAAHIAFTVSYSHINCEEKFNSTVENVSTQGLMYRPSKRDFENKLNLREKTSISKKCLNSFLVKEKGKKLKRINKSCCSCSTLDLFSKYYYNEAQFRPRC